MIKSKPKKFKTNKSLYLSLEVNELSIEEIEHFSYSENCPLCEFKLQYIDIKNASIKIRARKCPNCGKIYLCKEYYDKICSELNNNYLSRNIMIMDYLPKYENINIYKLMQ